MRTIKTPHGTLYLTKSHGVYQLLDSEKRILFWDKYKWFLLRQVNNLKKAKTIIDWLKQFDDVCWNTSKEGLHDWVEDYQEVNGRRFSEKLFEDNWNKIGDTYVFFELSDCFDID